MKKSLKHKGKLPLNLQMFATQTYPETNLQTREVLKNFKPIEIDYVNVFEKNIKDFARALGISRLIPVSQGTVLKMYAEPKVTLEDGTVAEGELIPLSKVEPQVEKTKEIGLKKWRKATSAEAIQKFGQINAINLTDKAIIKEIQSSIRKELFSTLQADTAKIATTMKPGTLQGALAAAWGNLAVLFDNDAVRVVAFANPMDIAQQIANKELTLENQFGLNYYTSVTGTVVFATTQVKAGTIFATAPDNLQIAYINARNSEVQRAFSMTSDNSGFLLVGHDIDRKTATVETTTYSGILMFPERLDGIVKVEIGQLTA
ncbi:phage capsid protein [Facklamia hominis]|uniref:phage capsid protein n=1 Tax=Facklamia hominis TaxID=178214 RepID=UPI0038FCF15B